MKSVGSNDISLKYQRFTTLGSKDIGILNSEFVAKTQFLWPNPGLLLNFVWIIDGLSVKICKITEAKTFRQYWLLI